MSNAMGTGPVSLGPQYTSPDVLTKKGVPCSASVPLVQQAVEITRPGGERRASYGHCYDDFNRIADMWSAIVGTHIPGWKVPLMMICVKISREINSRKDDNIVDLAGYADTLQQWYEKATELDALNQRGYG